MADNVVIRAEGLSKKYAIGHQAERERYVALRDVMARSAKGALARLAGHNGQKRSGDTVEEFWALKDVSFEVKRGEVLGIIGRNGAGKSTLLKILSRITEPSEGRVTIHGRVASLLEVGTGFHPELTGRENIYLNGAILGMTRAEIRRKFDEIVAFAEVEKFLDTPVKRYSSGMYVRLAFAVAAHLEPEILVVDEVLAVGDAEFQKKCLGKMGEVARGGRTVLFVSHNMAAVSALCSTGMLLKEGRICHEGEVEGVIAAYFGEAAGSNSLRGRHLDLTARVSLVELGAAEAIRLEFEITLQGPLRESRLGIGIADAQGVRIATVFTETAARLLPVPRGASRRYVAVTEPVYLAPGVIWLKVSLAEQGQNIETHEDAIRIIVPEYMPFRYLPHTKPSGPILLPLRTLTHVSEEFAALSA